MNKALRQTCIRGTFWINLSIVVCISERLKRQKIRLPFPAQLLTAAACSKVLESFKGINVQTLLGRMKVVQKGYICLERKIFFPGLTLILVDAACVAAAWVQYN